VAGEHTAAPASDVMPVEHDWQALEPTVPENVPEAQEVHEVEDPSPYVPGGHGVHPPTLEEATQYVPAPQHTEPPDTVHWL